VDLERDGLESSGDLRGCRLVPHHTMRRALPRSRNCCTFSLIASSSGVCDAMVENGLVALARPNTARRNIGQILEVVGCFGDVPPTKIKRGEPEVVPSGSAAGNQSPVRTWGREWRANETSIQCHDPCPSAAGCLSLWGQPGVPHGLHQKIPFPAETNAPKKEWRWVSVRVVIPSPDTLLHTRGSKTRFADLVPLPGQRSRMRWTRQQ
jgi:hypothetical protein